MHLSPSLTMASSLLHLSALVFCLAILCQTAFTYDDGSTFLHFVKKPQGHIDFSNTTGTAVECSASEGNEATKPSIIWIFPDGSKVTNISNLRQIFPDGRMVFNPFSSESFRQDVHAATYHCMAIGERGKLLSSDIKIRAVMDVDYEANVYDVFAVRGNTAVVKCHVPQFLKDYVSVVSFIKDDSVKIGSNPQSDSKYVLTSHGALYIKEVQPNEAGNVFKCQTYNRLTKHLKTSPSSGKLIITYPQGKILPKIADFIPSITTNSGDNVFLPCVAQGQPVPQTRWLKKNENDVLNGNRFSYNVNGLFIKKVSKSDSGTYICHINNTFGSDQTEMFLSVKVPIKVNLLPKKQTVNVGSSVTFECQILNGKQSFKIKWIKDGHSVNFHKVQRIDDYRIRISSVSLEDKGIYQCLTSLEETDEHFQASAEIVLGKFEPIFRDVFEEAIVQPSSSIVFACLTAGNPLPKISWSLDGSIILNNQRTIIENRVTVDGLFMSTLTIKSIVLEDGGTYTCAASNEIGKIQHVGRLNVYGPLKSRTIANISAVAGNDIALFCPVYGYPIDAIRWGKGKDRLPIDARQKLLPNGTLIIKNIQRNIDNGLYVCTATNKAQQTASGHLHLSIMILPKIAPFAFQEDLVREGMRAQIQCAVSEGDTPMTIQWLKDGLLIKNNFQDILINQVDDYSSNLAIRSVSPKHNGNFSCIVSNQAGATSHTTRLSVNALPKIIPFVFQDDQNFKGMRAHITCAVSQGDLPLTFHWLKNGVRVNANTSEMGVHVANYDKYSSFLSIQSVTSENSGNYTCVAINEAGKDSYTARLIVQVAPKIVPFNFQGESLLEGVFARVSCVVYQGDLPIQINWSKDGKIIENNKFRGTNVRTVDDFTSILTIDRVTVGHSGNYTCEAKNSAASTIHVAQLVVKIPPKILPFTFQEDELAEGTYVRVACVVGRGDLPLQFSWTRDEKAIPDDILIRQIDDYSSVLSIDRVAISHSGIYTCKASNTAATAAYSSTLNVYVPPKWVHIPNGDVFTNVGEKLILSCEAEGYPNPVVTWTSETESGSYDSMKNINENERFKVHFNGTMVINDVQESDAGSYICTATNGIGVGLSRIVNLNVNVPITIVNKSHDPVVRIGQPLILRCLVRGEQPINFTWVMDGKLLSTIKHNQRYITKKITEANAVTIVELSVASVTKSDNAIYNCKVKGKQGEDEATIKVTIEGPPDSPFEVLAVNKGENTIEVTWKTPFDNHSPISKYVVFYETKDARVLNRTTYGSETKIVLSHLQPSSTYKISVFAENVIGRSETPGSVQIDVTGEAPSSVPETISVQPQNGRSIRVSWQPPNRSTWNGAILGYYVGYREAATGQPYEYQLLEIPEGYDKGLSFTLNELKEFTSYSVVVQAFNEHGKGPLSEEILAMTSEGVPSRPPMAIDCSPTSSQTIVVNWEQPQEIYIHGILRGYKILYWTPDNRNGVKASNLLIQNTTDIKITLRGLLKYANYSIQVLAYTFAGDGVGSKPIYCHTLEDVPSFPREIKAAIANRDSVHLSWSPPSSPNGHIDHYTVYLQEVNNQDRLSKHRETRLVLTGNKTYHQVRNLRHGQKYEFHVTASTAIGEGPSSKSIEVDLAKNNDKLAARVTVFGETIKQNINKPAVLLCPAVGQPAPKRSWYFRDEVLSNEDPRITIQPDGALQIATLYHSDTGNYTCHVENEYGDDNIIYELYVKVPPSAPSVLVTSTTFENIVVNWKTPSSMGNAPILGYTLNYKQEFGPWLTVDLQPYLKSYTVGSLQCGSTYHLYIAANNEVGVGQPSDTITATTAGGVPNLPTKEKLIEERTHHVVLQLDSWESNGCPILYFVIEYKQTSGRSWSLLSNELKPNRSSIVLDKLQSNTLYSLRMAAHTSAGSTVGEYEFLTLDDKKNELNDSDGNGKVVDLFSLIDFNILVTILSCTVVVLLCLSITCFWIKRHKKVQNRPSIGSTPSLRPRSNIVEDDDDEISPYAMVKLSDFQKQLPGTSNENSRPTSHGATPKRFSNYIPTAPPMSESYCPNRAANVVHARKYPVLPGQTLYAMPNKEKMRHLRSEPDGAPNFNEPAEDSTFDFPPPPPPISNDLENQYDPPPPDMEWLCSK